MYIARMRDLVSARVYTAWSKWGGGGGHVYEIKTLRSNLATEEGGRCFFRGGHIIVQVWYSSQYQYNSNNYSVL